LRGSPYCCYGSLKVGSNRRLPSGNGDTDRDSCKRRYQPVKKALGRHRSALEKDSNGHLVLCKLRLLLRAFLRFALRASLRLFEIVPDDFIAVLRLAGHTPQRFSTNC
jgi:hypothetical protein